MNYNEKLHNITSLLKSQEERINKLNTNLKEIILVLEQNNRQILNLKRKKRIKSFIYFLILIFIFAYFDIFQLAISFYNYYYNFVDFLNKITSFSQNTLTIQNDIQQILEYQQNILEKMDINQQKLLQQTFQNTSKTLFSTPKVLKPFG